MTKLPTDPEAREKHIIETILEPYAWKFGMLQDVETFLGSLERYGIGLQDVRSYINKRKLELVEQQHAFNEGLKVRMGQWDKNVPRCPDCGYKMNLFQVNTGRRNNVGGNYKTQWLCGNQDCLHTDFSEKSITEWHKEILRGD